MSKVLKNTLIIGALICAVGLILALAGYLLGGNDYVAQADLNKMDASAMRSDNIYIQEKVKVDDIRGLNIDLEYIDLHLKPSDDDSCYLEYTLDRRWVSDKNADPLIWDVKDGVLSMKEAPTKSRIVLVPDIGSLLNGEAFEEEKNEVIVYMPEETVLSDSNIHLDGGDAFVSGLFMSHVEISLEYGDMIMKDTEINEGSLSFEDGDFIAEKSDINMVEIEIGYGDFIFTHGMLNGVQTEVSDGDSCFKDVFIEGNCEITGRYGDVEVKLNQDCLDTLDMQLDVGYGDIDIAREIDGSRATGDGTATFARALKNATASLKITLDDGDIVIK